MKKKFTYLTKMSLFKKIKSKWFLGVNLIFALLVIFLFNIDTIITSFGGDFKEETEIILLDKTEEVGSIFSSYILSEENTAGESSRYEIKIAKQKSEEEAKKKLKNENQVLLIFEEDPSNYLAAKIISKGKISALDYQIFVQAMNQVKNTYALSLSNIDPEEMQKISSPISIQREVLTKEQTIDESMDTIMGTVFPTIILPFFMLTIFLVQMIGADICEEKSTRSMEVIISNVSPKVHFASKVVAANLFVFIQGALLFLDVVLAFFIRSGLSNGNALGSLSVSLGGVWESMEATGFIQQLWYFIPLVLLLMLVSFIAYSLLAGILASITTNLEDFQQIQTPIIIISLVGYYLAMMAAVFKGSWFIHALSYVPFVSSLLSPALFVLGEVGILDLILSILITIVVDVLLVQYGMRVYKAGILNYSNEKVWKKFAKTIKNKDV